MNFFNGIRASRWNEKTGKGEICSQGPCVARISDRRFELMGAERWGEKEVVC